MFASFIRSGVCDNEPIEHVIFAALHAVVLLVAYVIFRT